MGKCLLNMAPNVKLGRGEAQYKPCNAKSYGRCYLCRRKRCDKHGKMCHNCSTFMCNECHRKEHNSILCQKIIKNNILIDIRDTLAYGPNSATYHAAAAHFAEASKEEKNE